VVGLMQGFVDQRMMQATMDEVDEAVGEDEEDGEL